MKFNSFVLLFLLSTSFIFAQSEAGLSFLSLQQSPILNGVGRLGAAFPNSDVFGYYYNPAILGYTARQNHASFGYMNRTVDGFYWSDPTLNTYGLNLGYNFAEKNKNLPLTVGFGYMYNYLDYGYNFPGDNKDSFHSFSFGAGLDYGIQFNVGFAVKFVNSKLSNQAAGEEMGSASVNTTAFDFGAMILAPISSLLFPDAIFPLGNETLIKPKANFALGYSLTNLGDEIYYIDPAQADPIPRTAQFGYSFNIGAELNCQQKNYTLIDYSFGAEVSDILIEPTQLGYEYQGLFGDINISKNLIQLKSDDKTVVHKGHAFTLFETIIITSGRFYGKAYNNIKTSGWGISSAGVFKFLSNDNDESFLNYLLKNIVIEYNYASTSFNEMFKDNYSGFSIRYTNFEL